MLENIEHQKGGADGKKFENAQQQIEQDVLNARKCIKSRGRAVSKMRENIKNPGAEPLRRCSRTTKIKRGSRYARNRTISRGGDIIKMLENI